MGRSGTITFGVFNTAIAFLEDRNASAPVVAVLRQQHQLACLTGRPSQNGRCRTWIGIAACCSSCLTGDEFKGHRILRRTRERPKQVAPVRIPLTVRAAATTGCVVGIVILRSARTCLRADATARHVAARGPVCSQQQEGVVVVATRTLHYLDLDSRHWVAPSRSNVTRLRNLISPRSPCRVRPRDTKIVLELKLIHSHRRARAIKFSPAESGDSLTTDRTS